MAATEENNTHYIISSCGLLITDKHWRRSYSHKSYVSVQNRSTLSSWIINQNLESWSEKLKHQALPIDKLNLYLMQQLRLQKSGPCYVGKTAYRPFSQTNKSIHH